MLKAVLGEAFPIIERVAPTVAAALGTPMGGLVTTQAVMLLAHLFGVDGAELHKLGGAIVNDPDAEKKLTLLDTKLLSNTAPVMTDFDISIKFKWANPA